MRVDAFSICALLVLLFLLGYVWLSLEVSESYVGDNKFLTCTLAPTYVRKIDDEAIDDDYFSCAGLGHVRMCLANLMIVAQASGRKAILPPPWLYLHKIHNDGRELDKDVWWDRYFDMEGFIRRGVLARDRFDIHERTPLRGKVRNSKYVDPSLDPVEIRVMLDKVVTLKFYEGWGKDGHAWSCGAREVGAGIGHGWQREVQGYPFPPSDKVKRAARKIAVGLGHPFAIIHVRRGDITKGGEYWNLDPNKIEKVTSGPFIRDFLKKNKVPSNMTILIMSNETNVKNFDAVKEEYPSVVFEQDLDELRRIKKETGDNFLVYEICRYLGILADIRVSTSPCYFHGGDCQLKLADGLNDAN